MGWFTELEWYRKAALFGLVVWLAVGIGLGVLVLVADAAEPADCTLVLPPGTWRVVVTGQWAHEGDDGAPYESTASVLRLVPAAGVLVEPSFEGRPVAARVCRSTFTGVELECRTCGAWILFQDGLEAGGLGRWSEVE